MLTFMGVCVDVCLYVREKKESFLIKLTGFKGSLPEVAVKDRSLRNGLTPSNLESVSHFWYLCFL
jgi:hypothetical protein